ncbi:MAG: hypothetical protein AB9846_17805 [Tenuifilaceae bacterium]
MDLKKLSISIANNMKKIAVVTLLVLNFSGFCQEVKHEMNVVPKKANKILIDNSMTFEENYFHVGKILVQNGYGLKTSNKDFGLFETSPKQMKRRQGWTGIFNIVVADSLITVTGQFTAGVSIELGSGVRSEASYYEIKYMGKGLYDNTAFYEMMDLAKKFGPKIKYVINSN